jgi:glycine cleavage system H protein
MANSEWRMKKKEERRRKEDAMIPCVWMSAGLVSFKLCDREGECEGCPFDLAMRGLAAEPGGGEAAGEPAAAPWSFPADRGYHRGHGWAQEAGAGRLRVGIDALAARLWSRVSGAILPALGSRLAAGETACWLQDGPELLALASPVAGTVVARNGAVLADPSLVAAAPYDAGWLFEVEAAAQTLLPAGEASAAAADALAGFRAAAAEALGRGGGAVGPTLQDGGEPLTDLRAMLGPSRYAGLVRRHLSVRTARRRARRA